MNKNSKSIFIGAVVFLSIFAAAHFSQYGMTHLELLKRQYITFALLSILVLGIMNSLTTWIWSSNAWVGLCMVAFGITFVLEAWKHPNGAYVGRYSYPETRNQMFFAAIVAMVLGVGWVYRSFHAYSRNQKEISSSASSN